MKKLSKIVLLFFLLIVSVASLANALVLEGVTPNNGEVLPGEQIILFVSILNDGEQEIDYVKLYTDNLEGAGDPIIDFEDISTDELNQIRLDPNIPPNEGIMHEFRVNVPENQQFGIYTSTIYARDDVGNQDSIGYAITVIEPNHAPIITLTSPIDEATDVPTIVTLTWEGNDDDNDVLTYTVYLNDEIVEECGNIEESICLLTNLDYSTEYRWYVRASDGELESTSDDWSFTTEDSIPIITLSLPVNGAVFGQEDITLTWTSSDEDEDELTHTVYLDNEVVGGCEDIGERICVIRRADFWTYGAEYQWYVEVSDGVHTVDSEVRTFRIIEEPNHAPEINLTSPVNGATDRPTTVNLLWTSSDEDEDELTHTVYLNNHILTGCENIEQTGCTVPNLNYETTYSWKITVSDGEDETTSAVWSFTTVSRVDPNPILNSLKSNVDESIVGGSLIISGQEETNPRNNFRIRNNGNVVLENIKMTLNGVFTEGGDKIGLKVGDKYLSTDGLNPINLGSLEVGASVTIEIIAEIPGNMKEDSYEGIINLFASNYEDETTQTFNLIVRVEPQVCKDGRISGGSLVNNPGEGNIRIIDLDVDDDSLDIGETIDATVEVETNDDFDIVIEAMLYDVDSGKEIIDWVIVVEEALDDDRDSYDFTLEIPVDNDEIDPSDTYILYVKAYEDGDENKNCNYDGIEMEIGRDSDNVIVTEFTITPLVLNILNSGHTVQMSVNVLNIGEDKQEDVYVKVMNTELGLDLSSNKFDLKEYDKSDNEMSTTLNFQISEDAVAGTYQVEARVYFKDGREYSSLWMPITVEAADVTTQDTTTEGTQNEVVTGTVTTGTTQTYNPTGGFLGSISGSSIFWVIGDVVLAILVIVLLVLIFRRK